MMNNKDPNYVAKLEKAIEKKYGPSAIENPKSKWNKEKEKEHLKQTRAFYEKVGKNQEKAEKETRDGFMVSKRFLSSGSKRSCETCGKYSFSFQDDVYFTKYDCCFECYINYIEDREDRWLSGWRPNNTKAFND